MCKVRNAEEFFAPGDASKLLKQLYQDWIERAEKLRNELGDVDSVRYREISEVTRSPMPSSVDSFKETMDRALRISHELVGSANLTDPGLRDSLTHTVNEMDHLYGELKGATSIPEIGDGPLPEWWEKYSELHGKLEQVGKISLRLAPRLGSLHDCGQIAGQLLHVSQELRDVLILTRQEKVEAIAKRTVGARDVGVHDIVAEPSYIAIGGRGAGAALMEYMAREAKAIGGSVSLLSLSDSSGGVYQRWGVRRSRRLDEAAVGEAG